MMAKEEFESLREKENLLKKTAEILRVPESDVPKTIERFLKDIEKSGGK